MEQKNSTSTILIDDPQIADFLLNYQTQQLLHPFLGSEESVANAAQSLNMSISALLYRVQKMQKWQLLQISREERRAGRAIKMYSSTSNSYFVPFGVASAETLALYLTETKQYFEQKFTQNVAEVLRRADEDWGMRVFKDENGRIRTQMAIYPDHVVELGQMNRAMFDFYYPDLQLDQADADALQQELGELFQKYAAKKGAHRYMIHLGLTPIVTDI